MNTKRRKNRFDFKQFSISQEHSAMKVGTDGVLIGAWANVNDVQNVLDIGTGTGLIALMIAQRTATAKIDGIEMDEHACMEARVNVLRSPWSDRTTIIHGKIQDFSRKTSNKYDLIISNPPYFTGGMPSPLEKRHQARHNLGLSPFDLLNAVHELLQEHGKFCLILPPEEGASFIKRASACGLFPARKTAFYPTKAKPMERWLLEFQREKKKIVKTDLVQYDSGGEWTSAYKSLTRDFYLRL